jgi:hypothetical protein
VRVEADDRRMGAVTPWEALGILYNISVGSNLINQSNPG